MTRLGVGVRRLADEPIIRPDALPGADGANINGPSLILAPDWLPGRLGRFYLYFAHHHGTYIRLAYADDLKGPWRIHPDGALRIADTPGCRDHIASPDVHVDHERRQIRMYFHGVSRANGQQLTWLATSADGLDFTAEGGPLASFYLRAVRWRDGWLGMAKGGLMYASKTGTADFRPLPSTPFPVSNVMANAPGDVRHVALRLVGDDLQVFFTRIGDRPERILRARIDLSAPPEQWQARDVISVLGPETAWEGADEPPTYSAAGAALARENALRDPAIFEHDERVYLLYSVAGEQGIAIAELTSTPATATGLRPTQAPAVSDEKYRERLAALSAPGRLEAQLSANDQTRPLKRIFIMGCARSGTWLLTALMTTFDDVAVTSNELPVEHFGLLDTTNAALVLKRDRDAYLRVEDIPERIAIAYIVRHPYDVLTSHNPTTGHRFHVPPHRWLGEMLALQYLLDTRRANTRITRYEDLVASPDRAQAEIGAAFGLRIGAPAASLPQRFKASPTAAAAMHGVRPIDRSSIGRYKTRPEYLERLRAIRPRLGRTLDWVAQSFGYDISL